MFSFETRVRVRGTVATFAIFAMLICCQACSPGAKTPQALTTDQPSSKPQRQQESGIQFENLAANVKYVGNKACVSCHQEQGQSYELTAHRHALAEIQLAEEPQPGSYRHAVSGKEYEVIQDAANQKLIHRERLIDGQSPDLVQEHGIRYVIGSGHHSRTYLLELDGFLIESPITWYTNQSRYAMSPGYDRVAHGSFERIADLNCLLCHAGEVSATGGNTFKPTIHQQTIGCESCHGAGEVHLRRHQDKSSSQNQQADSTIVNPRRLTREASEAVCANCHLRGTAAVTQPGKTMTSFRPGMLLQDCRVDYQLAESDGGMKVVGHVEQMHLSQCYVKSGTMTCTTCHDPHSMTPMGQRRQAYMDACIKCHEAGCASPPEPRLTKVPDNNCMTCHMPQSPTDIPHFAFTHHRIGLHAPVEAGKNDATKEQRAGKLVPVFETKSSPAIEKRNLGLAYFELAESETLPQVSQEYRARAEAMLLDTYQTRHRDAEVESALARISWDKQDLAGAMQLAQSAIQSPVVSSRARLNSLFIIGESALQMQDYALAKRSLEALVKDRRIYADWLLLTLCYSRSGQLDEAARTLTQAIKINPVRREAHEMIIEVFKRQNKTELVKKHSELLKELPAAPGR